MRLGRYVPVAVFDSPTAFFRKTYFRLADLKTTVQPGFGDNCAIQDISDELFDN